MMSHLCNRCVREFLILARTWFAFGLPSKTGCDILAFLIIQIPNYFMFLLINHLTLMVRITLGGVKNKESYILTPPKYLGLS
jgi:hypothetical protein